MPLRAGFRLSRIVIIESLKPCETKTGLMTANFVRAMDSAVATGIPIEYRDCDSAHDFVEILKDLTINASQTHSVPLLHVECHGDDLLGLRFRDESAVSWPELSALLVDLNKATRFNLISVFSACYGAYFLSRLSTEDPSPCYAMLAPTEAIWPDEILGAFRAFYSEFFSSMDAGHAMSNISKHTLQEGAWMSQLAESWYEHVVTSYIQQHCTSHEIRMRTLRTLRVLQASGVATNMHHVKMELIRVHREHLVGSYFDRYFMIDDIPENATRFRSARSRIEKRMGELRATGRYGI